MRHLIKLVTVYFLILFLIVICVYATFAFKGKELLIGNLEEITKKKVSIGHFLLSPTFHLQFKDVNIEGTFKAETINIAPSILRLFTGRLAFNSIKIQNPELIFEIPAAKAAEESKEVPPAKEKVKAKKTIPLSFICKLLKVWDGKLIFIDHTQGQEQGGFSITVDKINFYLHNFNTSHSHASDFQLLADIPWEDEKEVGKIKAEGWVNLFKMNMEADLKISDIDGIHFYPYYSQWVDLEKARIEKAKLNFTSDISSLNNDLTAVCHLELTDIVFTPRTPEEAEEKAEKIATVVLDMFKALDEGRIVLDFTIKTNMDNPQFRLGDLRTAFEDKLMGSRKGDGVQVGDVFAFPGRMLGGMVKGATDMSKAVIGGTLAIGKEIKDSVQGAFKKEGNITTQEKTE